MFGTYTFGYYSLALDGVDNVDQIKGLHLFYGLKPNFILLEMASSLGREAVPLKKTTMKVFKIIAKPYYRSFLRQRSIRKVGNS